MNATTAHRHPQALLQALHACAVSRALPADVTAAHLPPGGALARVMTLLISDVPGDDPQVIASGPTVPTLMRNKTG